MGCVVVKQGKRGPKGEASGPNAAPPAEQVAEGAVVAEPAAEPPAEQVAQPEAAQPEAAPPAPRTWAIACAPIGWPDAEPPEVIRGAWPAEALAGGSASPLPSEALARHIVARLPEAWRIPLAGNTEAALGLAVAACAFEGATLTHDDDGQVWVCQGHDLARRAFPLPVRLLAALQFVWPGGGAAWGASAASGGDVPEAVARALSRLEEHQPAIRRAFNPRSDERFWRLRAVLPSLPEGRRSWADAEQDDFWIRFSAWPRPQAKKAKRGRRLVKT